MLARTPPDRRRVESDERTLRADSHQVEKLLSRIGKVFAKMIVDGDDVISAGDSLVRQL